MKNSLLTKLVFSLFLALLLHAPASQATTAQDIWYVPSESGWGMDVIQQGSGFGFAMYVYDQNQNPTWYLGSGSSSGNFVWSGQMYSYRGPYFGGFFNPGAVGANQVGSFTFTLKTIETATLSYMINGATVTKTVSRFSIANRNLTGSYVGNVIRHAFSCSVPITNPYTTEAASLSITQNGSSVSMTSQSNTSFCTYNGTYTQEGRYGRVIGSYACSIGTIGTLSYGNFDLFEIDSDITGFFGRFTGDTSQGGVTCSIEGRIGGINTSTSSF